MTPSIVCQKRLVNQVYFVNADKMFTKFLLISFQWNTMFARTWGCVFAKTITFLRETGNLLEKMWRILWSRGQWCQKKYKHLSEQHELLSRKLREHTRYAKATPRNPKTPPVVPGRAKSIPFCNTTSRNAPEMRKFKKSKTCFDCISMFPWRFFSDFTLIFRYLEVYECIPLGSVFHLIAIFGHREYVGRPRNARYSFNVLVESIWTSSVAARRLGDLIREISSTLENSSMRPLLGEQQMSGLSDRLRPYAQAS